MIHKLCLLSLILGLSACASLSEDECRVGDWQGIGYGDGTRGRMVTYFAEHVQSCSKLGIYPSQEQWLRGREQGLQHYCRADNAYRLGKSEYAFNPVCPPQQLDELNHAYRTGREYARINKLLHKDYEQRKTLQNELKKLRKGENLHFATEQEARAYLLQLPYRLQKINWQIEEKKMRLEDLKWF